MANLLDSPALPARGLPPQATAQPALARGHTVRRMLWWLALLCVLPGATVGASLIWMDAQRRQAEAEQTALTAARAMASTLDRDLASIVATLNVLATEPTLRQGDLAAFQQRAAETLVHQNITNYVLIDRHFQQRVNTLRPWGTPLPTVAGPPELRHITEAGEVVLSDLFIGPVTGQPIVGLGVPVYVAGEVAYSLNVGIEPERLSQILQGARLPDHWVGAIIDRQGRVVARTRLNERYVGRQATADLMHALRQHPQGTVKTHTLEGIPSLGAFRRLEQFGWTVAIGIPLEELQAPWRESLSALLLSNALLVGLAWVVAWQVARRRFVLPMEALMQRMQRLACRQHPGARCTADGTAELQALEAGFDELCDRLALHESEGQAMIRRLSDTLEHMGDGFMALDHAGHVVHLNTQAVRLLGRPLEGLQGHLLHEVFGGREGQPLAQACQQAQALQQSNSLLLPLMDAQRWLEVDLHPAEWGVAVYFRDVSEAQRLREAQAAKLVAESANRAKTEFLSRMSHELRTPLNAVLGFAQLLRMDAAQLSDRHAGMVAHIEDAGQHLLAMISDVLDLSRIESGTLSVQPATIDALEVGQRCVAMLGGLAERKQVQVRTEVLTTTGTRVLADPTRLQQVLLNLLSNAVKYNRPGGSVTLRMESMSSGPLRITVQDDGPGLSPEQAAHLFEPFNRLGQEHGSEAGTGIGLVITQRIVGLMGGTLQAACLEGQGCAFWFELPTEAQDQTDLATSRPSSQHATPDRTSS